MPKHHNSLEFSALFRFTTNRQLTDWELGNLHKALCSALSQQD